MEDEDENPEENETEQFESRGITFACGCTPEFVALKEKMHGGNYAASCQHEIWYLALKGRKKIIMSEYTKDEDMYDLLQAGMAAIEELLDFCEVDAITDNAVATIKRIKAVLK